MYTPARQGGMLTQGREDLRCAPSDAGRVADWWLAGWPHVAPSRRRPRGLGSQPGPQACRRPRAGGGKDAPRTGVAAALCGSRTWPADPLCLEVADPH